MRTITDLPIECVHEIIQYLTFKELLNLRLINKYFLSNVNNLNLRRLFIYNSRQIKETGLINDLKSFLNYNKEIDHQNYYICLSNKNDISLNPIFKFNFLKNLRELYFVHSQHLIRSNSLFELTNNFPLLEVLEILFTFNTGGDYLLNLNNLRLLSIGSTSDELEDEDFKVILNCPNLQKLKVYGIIVYAFELINPNKITYLEVDVYEQWIDNLINLETLICINIGDLNENVLNKLAKLKELKFYKPDYGIWNLKQLKNKLTINFKVYFCDVYINDNMIINFDENFVRSILLSPDRFVFSNSKQYSFQIILESYPEICSELCIESIDYKILENHFKTIIPDDFIRRLVHLKFIVIDKPINQELFINFLSNFKTLNYLKLHNSNLNQQFYSNNLTKLCSYLKFLTIKDKECQDFNFLLQFKNLNKIRIDQNLENDQIIINVFKKFKNVYFSQFKFYYRNSKIKISIGLKGDFKLHIGSKKKPYFYFDMAVLLLNLNRFIDEKFNIKETINLDIKDIEIDGQLNDLNL